MPLSAILPPEYLEQAEARIKEATRAVGLPFNRHPRVPNTHLAHEAAMFAEAHGKGDEFHRAVLRAYFAEATWIGHVDGLVGLGERVGLNGSDLREALETGRYRAAVDQVIAHNHAEGITAVPAFIFGEHGMLSGAQPYEIFERAMALVGVARRQR